MKSIPLTEAHMRAELDGSFMAYHPNLDDFIFKEVKPDFIPTFEAIDYNAKCARSARTAWAVRKGLAAKKAAST